MGYIIEISESKKEKLAEHIEKALHEMGKAMACVEQFGSMGERSNSYGSRYDEMNERSNRGNRGGSGGYGSRMGYRDDDDDDDDDIGERRRRSRRTGRYM